MLEAEGNFTIFLGLLATIDYSELDRTGMYTVFAPTDEAFAAFGPLEGVDTAALLAYHVAEGNIPSSALLERSPLTMIHGGAVTISPAGEELIVNDVATILEDLPASNGIIHVIDQVLTPPGG